jgi:hypothetical protein
MKTKAFIDQKAFVELIGGITNTSGLSYTDIDTIYRDLSRLAVVWVYRTERSELQRIYNEYGWKGKANIRAMKKCAEAWLKANHPKFL